METIDGENSTPKSKHVNADLEIYPQNYFKLSPDSKFTHSDNSDKFNTILDSSQESSSSHNNSSSVCGTGSAGTTANSPIINRQLTPTFYNKWDSTIHNSQSNTLESAGGTGGGDAPPVFLGSPKVPFSLTDIRQKIIAFGQNGYIACGIGERRRAHKYNSYGSEERYSRKVFVGGLPPDIDEQQIADTFQRFGPLIVDWPHKCETRYCYPPKGYAFLLFQHEQSVQQLIRACVCEEGGKLYISVSSPTIKEKSVQIRPWRLSDADFVLDPNIWLDPRKTVFVGGVPRPLKADELALVMDRYYGGVCYASIDTDPELKYPKGAARVCFSNQQSYISAISARFVHLQYADIEKRVEVKPYVLDDQICDNCRGMRCGGKLAPFFCANIICLQYYCEHCWVITHSRSGREFHKPLVKEGTDRPRTLPFIWK